MTRDGEGTGPRLGVGYGSGTGMDISVWSHQAPFDYVKHSSALPNKNLVLVYTTNNFSLVVFGFFN